MKFWLLITAALLFSRIEAALPPLFQSIREFEAVIQSEELANLLGSEEIVMSIEKQDDLFTIVTTKHTLKAKIVSLPQAMPGPRAFKVVFESASS
jgi:hypothetical protein